MPTKFADFFEQLMAPFEAAQIRRREPDNFQYVTQRTVMNRLDKVCGPEGWEDHYHETHTGVVCKLELKLPDNSHVMKCGSGTLVPYPPLRDNPSPGDVFKHNDAIRLNHEAAYAEAFKRAAVKFGVARYLYGEGLPALEPKDVSPDRPEPHRAVPPTELFPGADPPPAASASQPGPAPPRATLDPRRFLRTPAPGTAEVFTWVQEIGKYYRYDAVKAVDTICRDKQLNPVYRNWDQSLVDRVCKFLRNKATRSSEYNGEFNDLPGANSKAATKPAEDAHPVDRSISQAQENVRGWALHHAMKADGSDSRPSDVIIGETLFKFSGGRWTDISQCRDINELDKLVDAMSHEHGAV